MKVILKEKIPTLGNVGDIVSVSPGYARNFLVPYQKATVVYEGNVKEIMGHKKSLQKKIESEKISAEKIKESLEGQSFKFIKAVGANGKLFGSITASEIVKELGKKGIEIGKRNLILETAIRKVGVFNIKAKIFSGVEAEFVVEVEKDPNQKEERVKKVVAKVKEETEEVVVKEEELSEEERRAREVDRILKN